MSADRTDHRPRAQFSNPLPDLFSADGPYAAALRAFDPAGLFRQGLDFTAAMYDIAVGRSDITPDPKDWRFRDEAWTSNPFYKRLSQAYLAMCDAVEKMIPDDLPVEAKSRAELVASIATSAFAPTNTLFGNPAALSRTIETGGSNLERGFRAFLKDLFENRGLPRQVDDSSFEVGRNLAVTPGKVVLRTELFELIHYAPATPEVFEIPVLLIPPQIGRYYFTDLAPGRSFAEYTVSQGLQYFAVSWRNPSPEQRDMGMADYAAAVGEAIAAVLEITGNRTLNVVGFCAGGILSAMIAALFAEREPETINSFTLCVTMLDFRSDAALGAFRLPAMLAVAKAQSEMKGILPGEDLSTIFTWMRPNDLVWNYWVNNHLMGEEPPAFDILAWNKDSTNLPAKLHADFLELFDSNALVEPGAYRIDGKPVDLSQIACDSFVVGAVTDHLTPWKACYQSQRHLAGEHTFALSNGGHIAALVNPPGNSKAFHWIGPAAADDAETWLAGADKRQGSWWESWAKWTAQRSGAQVAVPTTLGSERYPELMDAPGRYVRE